MAVLMMFEAPGTTVAQYEQVNALMGIRGDDDAPDGLISHTAATTDDGIFIVDVWASEEALGRFFQEHLRAALAEAGLPEVQPRILPVLNQLHG